MSGIMALGWGVVVGVLVAEVRHWLRRRKGK